MNASRYISGRIRFGSKLSAWAAGISFFVIALSIIISSGFRSEIRKSLADTYGDILATGVTAPSVIDSIGGVNSSESVIFMNGIVRSGIQITGVTFRGSATTDSLPLQAVIPSSLARKMSLSEGDKLQTFFVGEKVKARNFTVTGIYEDLTNRSEASIVRVSADDLRRLMPSEDNFTQAISISLDKKFQNRNEMKRKAMEISILTGSMALSLPDRFPQLFDWMDLIDANVMAILVLMSIVAGFNMISGLLILLFRNISTIGTLKALGMNNRGIAKIFLHIGSVTVLKGMLIGNAVALAFCLIQGTTHILKLNPENYFLSFVPVEPDLANILTADIIAYFIIMALILLPTAFISKVDPATTIKEDQSR